MQTDEVLEGHVHLSTRGAVGSPDEMPKSVSIEMQNNKQVPSFVISPHSVDPEGER